MCIIFVRLYNVYYKWSKRIRPGNIIFKSVSEKPLPSNSSGQQNFTVRVVVVGRWSGSMAGKQRREVVCRRYPSRLLTPNHSATTTITTTTTTTTTIPLLQLPLLLLQMPLPPYGRGGRGVSISREKKELAG